jgi:hypothetical protein
MNENGINLNHILLELKANEWLDRLIDAAYAVVETDSSFAEVDLLKTLLEEGENEGYIELVDEQD